MRDARGTRRDRSASGAPPGLADLLDALVPFAGLQLAEREELRFRVRELHRRLRELARVLRVRIALHGADVEARYAPRRPFVDDDVDRDAALVVGVLVALDLDDGVEVAEVAVRVPHREQVGLELLLVELRAVPVEERRSVEFDLRELLQAVAPEPPTAVGQRAVAAHHDVAHVDLRALADRR